MAGTLSDAVMSQTQLIIALKNKKCVLFVGSGLSAAAGYKSWSGLIETLVSEAKKLPHARTAGIEEFEKDKDYFTLAEFARTALGVSRYGNILKSEFDRRASPTPAHVAIANTAYRGVITTNYDRLLEAVYSKERGWPPNDFTPESVSALAGAMSSEEPFIFKMHGNITSPESVVLTGRDYDRLILRSPHVRSFLQAVFLTNTLLFVGYSVRDPDFQLVLKELTLIFEGYTPTHYALLPKAPDFSIEDLLHRMNIQGLPYDPHDANVELTDALSELQKLAPAK